MNNPNPHTASFQYQATTSRAGNRQLDKVLLLLGELQNAPVKHRRMLGKLKVPTRDILQRQNAGLADLRANDPAFANMARRLQQSVLQRVNDAYQRAFSVAGAGFPQTRSPYAFQTLEISEPAVAHVTFTKHGYGVLHVKGLPELRFKTDHRIPMLEQPRVVRITRQGQGITVTLVYRIPGYPPKPAGLKSALSNRPSWLPSTNRPEGQVLQRAPAKMVNGNRQKRKMPAPLHSRQPCS